MKDLVNAGDLFAPALRVLSGGDTSRYNLLNGTSGSGPRVVARYAAVPSLANPRALLPLNAPPGAWRAVLEQHAKGAASGSARTLGRLLQVASFFGVGAALFRERVALVTTGNEPESPLHQLLAQVLGRKDFFTSLRIAPGRPNSKPVVQVVSPEGKALAYAKFGWDDLTKGLIRGEAEILRDLGPRVGGSGLHIPKVLHSGSWNGLEVLVVAPLENMRTTPWRLADMPVAASIALGSIRARSLTRLEDGAFWRRVSKEVDLAAPELEPPSGQILLAARSAIQERWGDVALTIGQSHGDWIPPNISIRGDGAYNVWDWERSEPDVPLGLDTLQFVLFVELNSRPVSTDLVRRVEGHARRGLLRQNLDPHLVQLLAPLSLMRSLLWFAEARRAGRDEPEDARFTRALEFFLTELRN